MAIFWRSCSVATSACKRLPGRGRGMAGVETATADARRLWAGPPFPPPEIAPEPANRVAPPSLLSRAGVLSSRNDVLPALVLAFDHDLDHGHAFLFVPVF